MLCSNIIWEVLIKLIQLSWKDSACCKARRCLCIGIWKKKPCIHSPWVWAFLPIVPRKVTLCSQPICLVEGELSQFLECSLEKRLIKKHQLGWSPEISFWSDFVIFFGGKMEFSSSTNHHIRLHNLGFIPRRGKQKLVISSFHCSQAFKGIF